MSITNFETNFYFPSPIKYDNYLAYANPNKLSEGIITINETALAIKDFKGAFNVEPELIVTGGWEDKPYPEDWPEGVFEWGEVYEYPYGKMIPRVKANITSINYKDGKSIATVRLSVQLGRSTGVTWQGVGENYEVNIYNGGNYYYEGNYPILSGVTFLGKAENVAIKPNNKILRPKDSTDTSSKIPDSYFQTVAYKDIEMLVDDKGNLNYYNNDLKIVENSFTIQLSYFKLRSNGFIYNRHVTHFAIHIDIQNVIGATGKPTCEIIDTCKNSFRIQGNVGEDGINNRVDALDVQYSINDGDIIGLTREDAVANQGYYTKDIPIEKTSIVKAKATTLGENTLETEYAEFNSYTETEKTIYFYESPTDQTPPIIISTDQNNVPDPQLNVIYYNKGFKIQWKEATNNNEGITKNGCRLYLNIKRNENSNNSGKYPSSYGDKYDGTNYYYDIRYPEDGNIFTTQDNRIQVSTFTTVENSINVRYYETNIQNCSDYHILNGGVVQAAITPWCAVNNYEYYYVGVKSSYSMKSINSFPYMHIKLNTNEAGINVSKYKAGQPFIKINNEWKESKELYIKVDGIWRQSI